LAQHRTKPNWLYAGTDVGVFTSSDGGASWSTFTDGPGTVPIAELVWRNDNTLLAITHGRGVFSAAINANIEPVAPRSYTIVRGNQFGPGQLQDVLVSDDQRLVVRPGVVLISSQAPIEVQFDATAPIANPATLSASIELRASAANIGYTVLGWNFNTNQWVQLGNGALSTTDNTIQVSFPGTASHFVEPNTRSMRLRVATKANGPVLVYPWTTEIDKVAWAMPSQ
jgi:hypothetical protein